MEQIPKASLVQSHAICEGNRGGNGSQEGNDARRVGFIDGINLRFKCIDCV